MTENQSDIKPLLTIAIPTYNRAAYLRELLSVLFDQLVAERRVELLISDNASQDETPAVVEEYRKRGLQIRSVRNDVNIGADGNFLQCFEMAGGRYFWLFGDDDIILPGGIAKILSLLAIDDFGVVYVHPYGFRKDYVTERTSDRFGRFAEILPSGLQLTQRVGGMLGFISAVIVNKESLAGTAHYPISSLAGTNLMQLGWVCPMLASDLRVLIVWEKLIGARVGNTVGWVACQVFGVNLKMVAAMTIDKRNDITTALCNRTLQDWFPESIMGVRQAMTTGSSSENMRATLEPIYKANWRYWVYAYPLITLPLSLAKALYALIRVSNVSGKAISAVLSFIFNRRNLITDSHPEHNFALEQ